MIASLTKFSEDYIRRFRELTGEQIHLVDRKQPDMQLLAGADVLIAMDRDFGPWLPSCPRLKLALAVGAGVDRLDFRAMLDRGIAVANVGPLSAEAMSDYAVGAMLAFSSRLLRCAVNQQNRYWEPYLRTRPLKDSRLLVVGAGKIGSRVAEKARAFGMRIEGVSRSGGQKPGFDQVYSMAELNDRLPEADYVVCILPLTDETRGMFNRERFERMKSGAIFINIARGAICDQAALTEALREGRIAGAALDVFEIEPLPADDPLWGMDNVLITPHSSGRLAHFAECTCEVFARNLLAWRAGEELITPVDLRRQY